MKLLGSFKIFFNLPPLLLILSLVAFQPEVSGAPNPWWDGRVCSWNIRCPYGYFCVDYNCQSNRIGYLEPIQRNDLPDREEESTTPFPFEPSVEIVNEEKSSSSGSSSSGASNEKSFSLDYDYKYAKRRL